MPKCIERPNRLCDDAMTQQELQTLDVCEATIQKGLRTFLEVGRALDTIREQRLYRMQYQTWDEYVRGRWNMHGNTASRYIDAARVSDYLEQALPETGTPKTIGAATALLKLKEDPEGLKAAWSTAVSNSEREAPKAGDVRKAVEDHLGVSSTVMRDQRRREEWGSGCFQVKTPSVTVSLTETEAQRLARLASKWQLSLPETCRRLVAKGLSYLDEA